MKLSQLFTRKGRMQATEERSEAQLIERQREIQAAISSGPPDLFELTEERERIDRQLAVLRGVSQKRQDEEYRARNAKTLADFIKRKDVNTKEINRHVVALLLALTDTRKLVIESANIPFDGRVKTTEEVFGFPVDFPDKIIAAIYEAAPQTQWDFFGRGTAETKGASNNPPSSFPPGLRTTAGIQRYLGLRERRADQVMQLTNHRSADAR